MSEASSKNDRRYVLLAFKIIGEFGAVIALPVVSLAYLGKHLDQRFGTAPWLKVAGFALASVITAVIVNRRARYYGEQMDAIGKDEGAPKNDQPKE